LPEIVNFYCEEHDFFATETITIISNKTMKSYDQLVLSYCIAMNASSRPLTRLKQIDQNTQLPSTCAWFKLKSVAVENFKTLNSLLASNNSIMFVKNIFDDEQSMQDDCVEIKYLIKGNVLQESRVIQLTTNGHNYSMPIDLLHRYRLQANLRIDATTSQILSTMNQRLNKLKIRYQNVGLAHMFELEFKQIIDEISVASIAQLSTTIDRLQNLIKKCVQMNADILENRLEQMSKNYYQTLKELNEYQLKWHCRCLSNDVPDLEKVHSEYLTIVNTKMCFS